MKEAFSSPKPSPLPELFPKKTEETVRFVDGLFCFRKSLSFERLFAAPSQGCTSFRRIVAPRLMPAPKNRRFYRQDLDVYTPILKSVQSIVSASSLSMLRFAPPHYRFAVNVASKFCAVRYERSKTEEKRRCLWDGGFSTKRSTLKSCYPAIGK